MWYLIFLLITFLLIFIIAYPFMIKFEIKFNLMKLKGLFYVKILNKFIILSKFRVKNGYVYIYNKNKERKEKLSEKNANVFFFLNLIGQIYFRQQLVEFDFNSNIGFSFDASITATTCGFVDVLTKIIMAKVKNNKKKSHIFISVEPKYNQDILNLRVDTYIRISLFDLLYALLYAKFYSWRNYEGKQQTD